MSALVVFNDIVNLHRTNDDEGARMEQGFADGLGISILKATRNGTKLQCGTYTYTDSTLPSAPIH